MLALLLKSQVKGYTKGDGTYVAPHTNKVVAKVKQGQQMALFNHKAPLPTEAFANVGAPAVQPPAAPKPAPKQATLFNAKPKGIAGPQLGGKPVSASAPPAKKWTPPAEKVWPNAVAHPQPHDDGKPVQINQPHQPSAEATWTDPEATAVFVPGGAVPGELNGVPLAAWADAPTDLAGWVDVAGQNPDLDEPAMPSGVDHKGVPKEEAAGVIIEEPDGRVWVMCPTNQFGGYKATFPKGRVDAGLTRQAAAIKECYEETGLQVEITGFHGDIERSTTVARYYTARRVGGSPAAMGWEAQAVQLVPKLELLNVLNTPVDHKILLMGEKE